MQEAGSKREAGKSRGEVSGDEMLMRFYADNQACLFSTMSESTLGHLSLLGVC
jgi:hypothetical protein